MLSISISSKLACEHARFMAGCAERGHRVEVFESSPTPRERPAGEDQATGVGTGSTPCGSAEPHGRLDGDRGSRRA
jgi:hypothetical protein